MQTNEFQVACKLSDLKPNQPHTLEINDRFVVVILLNSQVFCIDDLCTHDGGTLGDGEMDGNCLICPRHGAKFDVRTGAAMCMPATEPTIAHEVEIRNTDIFVRLKDVAS